MLRSSSLDRVLKRYDRLTKENIEDILVQANREQEKLTASIDKLPFGIVLLKDNKPLFLNKYALNYFQISESEKRDVPLGDLIRDDNLATWIQNNILSASQGFRNRLHFVDSNALIVSLEGKCEEGEEKTLTFLDVTDNLEEIEEMFRANRVESISQLASLVAHEIKNPLHSLSLHMTLLKNEIKDMPKISQDKKKKIDKSLEILASEMVRLDGLTNEFLKLGALKDRFYTDCDISKLLESVIEIIRPELESKEIVIKTTFDERLPKIPIQRSKLHQTFLNLIRNAIEAMPDKGGKISIKTTLVENCCQIEFKDTGAGIPKRNLEKIFEPYFSTKSQGNGLGLVVVKETVEDHGGSIACKSEEGKGAIFTVYLPIKPEILSLPKGQK